MTRTAGKMDRREISEDQVRAVLEEPDRKYPGDVGRTLAEKVLLEAGGEGGVRSLG